jgi:hypothetical protein
VAAKAIPISPASWYETMIPTQMTSVGAAVDSRLIASPWMTLVPCPVCDALAIDWTGR